MDDASQDSKDIKLSHLRDALLSSSTKRRGTGLANLHQQIVHSGQNGANRVVEVADRPQNYHKKSLQRLSTSSS